MGARKVIVWGMGKDYESILNQLKFEICKGNIECVGLTCEDQEIYCTSKDGFPVIRKKEIPTVDFDYVVVSSSKFFEEIKKEAMEMGISRKKIVRGGIFQQPLFDFGRYASLRENPVTILSDDCWGGFVYKRLDLPFTSPTVGGVKWEGDGYAKLISKPFFYLNTELQRVHEGDMARGIYPTGRLGVEGDYLEIKFYHCHNFTEGLSQWNRRVKRINKDNIFVKMGSQVDAPGEESEEFTAAFEKVPYNKIFFGYLDREIDGAFKTGRFFVYHGDGHHEYVPNFNYKEYCLHNYFWDLDILKLLTGDKNYSRY